MLLSDCVNVVIESIMGSTNVSHTMVFILRSTSSSEYLQDIEDIQIDKRTFGGIIDLSTFDDDRVRR